MLWVILCAPNTLLSISLTISYNYFQVLILSNCLTIVLGGSIELSLVTNVFIILLSQFIGAERLFWLCEQIFNSDNPHFGPAASSGYNFVWPLCISIGLTLFGVVIQRIWPRSKQCAETILRRLSIFYVLFVLIISYSYLFIMFGYSILMTVDYKDSSHLAANMMNILTDLLGYSLAIFGFIFGFAISKLFRQKTDQCIAIAVESIAENLCMNFCRFDIDLNSIKF